MRPLTRSNVANIIIKRPSATALISREPRVGSLPSTEGESAVSEPLAGEEPSAEMYIEQPFAMDSFENQTNALEAAVQKTEGERYAAFADQLTAAQYAPMFETLGLEVERHERVHQAIAAGIMERLRYLALDSAPVSRV